MNGPQKKPEPRWAIMPPASKAASSLSGEFRMDPPLRRRPVQSRGAPERDPEETPIESEVNALGAGEAGAETRPPDVAPGDRAQVEPSDSDRITVVSRPDFEPLPPDSSTRLVETIPAPASADEDDDAPER